MSHDEKKFDYDKERENYIKKHGINILRFTELEVMGRIDDVLSSIEIKIGQAKIMV